LYSKKEYARQNATCKTDQPIGEANSILMATTSPMCQMIDSH